MTKMVAQTRQILCVCLSIVSVWGGGVPNFGHFRALETPGGDLGFQGSILGPNTGRKFTFWAPHWGGFWVLLGYVFEVLFWKASGSRF